MIMISILQSVGRIILTFAFERLERDWRETGESGVIRTNIAWTVLGPISEEFSENILIFLVLTRPRSAQWGSVACLTVIRSAGL